MRNPDSRQPEGREGEGKSGAEGVDLWPFKRLVVLRFLYFGKAHLGRFAWLAVPCRASASAIPCHVQPVPLALFGELWSSGREEGPRCSWSPAAHGPSDPTDPVALTHIATPGVEVVWRGVIHSYPQCGAGEVI